MMGKSPMKISCSLIWLFWVLRNCTFTLMGAA